MKAITAAVIAILNVNRRFRPLAHRGSGAQGDRRLLGSILLPSIARQSLAEALRSGATGASARHTVLLRRLGSLRRRWLAQFEGALGDGGIGSCAFTRNLDGGERELDAVLVMAFLIIV